MMTEEESFWSEGSQRRLEGRVDAVMDHLVSTVPNFVTTEQVVVRLPHLPFCSV